MNSRLRSINVTSMSGAHMRMYLAAVAPPKPPPTTTTRPLAARACNGAPAAALAPAADTHFRNSRLDTLICLSPRWFRWPSLARGKPGGDRLDLLVGVALGVLVHHGGRALAVAK